MKIKMKSGGISRREFLKRSSLSTTIVVFGGIGPFSKVFPNRTASNFDFRYKTVPIARLKEVKKWFDELYHKDILGRNKNFKSYIDFNFDFEKTMKGARSIIISSFKQSLGTLTFESGDKQIKIIIPNQYFVDEIKLETAKNELRGELFNGHNVEMEVGSMPFKTIAVRSGLAEYGINNITFVRDFGSYHQLFGFLTREELPDQWGPLRTMRECRGCSICKKACPTKCIRDDQFVIDIDHCLTLYNELSDPFPEFIKPEIHHTLVGCMKCQWDCPANKSANERIRNLLTINIEETEYILSNRTNQKIQDQIVEKLEPIIPSVKDFEYFRRNTSLALKNALRVEIF